MKTFEISLYLGGIKSNLIDYSILWRQNVETKVFFFGHIMIRQNSLERTIMLRKVEDNRKGGRPNTR